MLAALARTTPRTRGILCIAAATVFLTANDSMIKWLSPYYPLHEIVLIRSLVAISITLFIVRLEGGLRILRTRRPVLHFIRGFLIVLANMAFFLGIAAMPLADATALFFVAPLIITMLSVPILGEQVGLKRWLAVFAGLAGVVIMMRPGFGVVSVAAAFPLLAALAYASMQMLTRRLGVTEKAAALAFYIQLTFILVSASIGLAVGDGRYGNVDNPSLAFFFRAWTWPSLADAGLMTLCGTLVACGGYLMSQAYRSAQAAVVAPFEYTALPLAVFWGYQLFGDLPDGFTILGILLIVGSGLFVFYRETLHERLIAARQPMTPGR